MTKENYETLENILNNTCEIVRSKSITKEAGMAFVLNTAYAYCKDTDSDFCEVMDIINNLEM